MNVFGSISDFFFYLNFVSPRNTIEMLHEIRAHTFLEGMSNPAIVMFASWQLS